jgi:hypothetical protein
MRREPIYYPYVCFAGRNETIWRRHDGTTFTEQHKAEHISRAERKRRRGIPRKH